MEYGAISNPERWCWECATLNMPASLENSAVATGLERSVFLPIPKKGNAKECSNYSTIALISHASKVLLTILQARLQQYVNHEFPDVQDGCRKGRRTRDKIANICWVFEKARESQKHIYFSLLITSKPLTMWIKTNCGKFLKTWEYKTTSPAYWEICMQVKKQLLEPDMEQQTGKGVCQGYILSPCLFNFYAEYITWNAGLDEAQPGIKILGEISITSDTQMIPPLWQKVKSN